MRKQKSRYRQCHTVRWTSADKMCVLYVEENVDWAGEEDRFRKGHVRKTSLGVGASGKVVKWPWASP